MWQTRVSRATLRCTRPAERHPCDPLAVILSSLRRWRLMQMENLYVADKGDQQSSARSKNARVAVYPPGASKPSRVIRAGISGPVALKFRLRWEPLRRKRLC